MERRRALVVAGTMTATLAMAGTAMAVNMGLLGSDTDPVGDLTATEIQPAAQREAGPTAAQREPRVRVVVQDIPIATGGGTSTGAVESGDDSVTGPAPTTPPAPYVDDDDGYDDDDSYDDSDDDGYDDDGGDDGDDHDDEDSDDSIDEPDDDD